MRRSGLAFNKLRARAGAGARGVVLQPSPSPPTTAVPEAKDDGPNKHDERKLLGERAELVRMGGVVAGEEVQGLVKKWSGTAEFEIGVGVGLAEFGGVRYTAAESNGPLHRTT